MNEERVQRVGLIGWPVEHSISPIMFSAAFAALKMAWQYEAFPVPPHELQQHVAQLQGRGLIGFNVTIPHKQAIMPLLDRVLPEAAAIGAVNTVVARHSETGLEWEGTNTDAAGFAADLQAHLPAPHPAGTLALVLGAGGAARAAVYALLGMGYHVVVASRTLARARELVANLHAHVPAATGTQALRALAWQDLAGVASTAHLIVNCTPVGMWPNTDASPWPESIPIPSGAFVYDMVYRPAETMLVRQAGEAGAQAVSGLRMLVRQGAAAFELWTGKAAPVDVMFDAAQHALYR
ncbi:MAG: shikimate dehydrogenase [Anaerolineae bacterium]